MTISTASDTRLNAITRRVRLRGLTPVMFDRYAGDNQTKLTWDQKIYLRPGTNELVLPALNIISFFTAHNTNSAPQAPAGQAGSQEHLQRHPLLCQHPRC